jgi:uncharacterized protein (DUF849 family)
MTPFILTVAPNGARRTKADHPAMPLTPAELAATAKACVEAGAAMLHFHVRDADGRHSLDPELYRAATAAVRKAVGPGPILQATSEAAGIYRPEEQIGAITAFRPEAVSVALREIVPDEGHESAASAFYAKLRSARVMVQHILYEAADLARFQALRARGVIPGERHALLFVLGRYTETQESDPGDLLPFLTAGADADLWSVCAFGRREGQAIAVAAALGGHGRVGFENNFHLVDSRLAAGSEELVAQAASLCRGIGRDLANADEAREIFAALD